MAWEKVINIINRKQPEEKVEKLNIDLFDSIGQVYTTKFLSEPITQTENESVLNGNNLFILNPYMGVFTYDETYIRQNRFGIVELVEYMGKMTIHGVDGYVFQTILPSSFDGDGDGVTIKGKRIKKHFISRKSLITKYIGLPGSKFERIWKLPDNMKTGKYRLNPKDPLVLEYKDGDDSSNHTSNDSSNHTSNDSSNTVNKKIIDEWISMVEYIRSNCTVVTHFKMRIKFDDDEKKIKYEEYKRGNFTISNYLENIKYNPDPQFKANNLFLLNSYNGSFAYDSSIQNKYKYGVVEIVQYLGNYNDVYVFQAILPSSIEIKNPKFTKKHYIKRDILLKFIGNSDDIDASLTPSINSTKQAFRIWKLPETFLNTQFKLNDNNPLILEFKQNKYIKNIKNLHARLSISREKPTNNSCTEKNLLESYNTNSLKEKLYHKMTEKLLDHELFNGKIEDIDIKTQNTDSEKLLESIIARINRSLLERNVLEMIVLNYVIENVLNNENNMGDLNSFLTIIDNRIPNILICNILHSLYKYFSGNEKSIQELLLHIPKYADEHKPLIDEINKYLTKEFPFFVIDKNDNLYNKIYDAQQEKLFSDLDGEELNDYQKCVQELKNSPGESIALTVPEKQKLKQLNEEKKNNNDLIESEISNVNTFLIYNSKLSTVPNLWSDPKIKILYEKIIHIHILNDTDTEIDKKIKKFKDQDIIVLTEKQKKEKEKEALNKAKRKFNSIYHLISHSKNEDLRTKVNENMKNHIIDLKKAFESGDNKTKKQIFESIFESIFYLINAYRENDKTAKKRGKHQNKTVKLKKK